MSQFLVRSRACWISLAFALAGCLFVNVIQIDGQQSGRPAAVPHPLYFPAGGLSMSVCAKQLQFLTDWNATKGAASSMTSVSNAGSAQQVLLSRLQDPCSMLLAPCAAGALLDLGAHIFCIHSPLSGITLCTHTHTRTPLPIHSLTHSFIFLGFGSAPLSCWQVQYAARHPLLHPYNIHTHNPPAIHPLTEWLCQLVAFRISSVRVHHFRYFPSTFHSSASCSPLYPPLAPFFVLFHGSNLNSYYLCSTCWKKSWNGRCGSCSDKQKESRTYEATGCSATITCLYKHNALKTKQT